MCIERLEIPAAVTLGEAEWGVDPPAEFQNHNISDIDILDLCREVAIATGQFTHDYTEDSQHSKSLCDSSNKLEEVLDEVLVKFSGSESGS